MRKTWELERLQTSKSGNPKLQKPSGNESYMPKTMGPTIKGKMGLSMDCYPQRCQNGPPISLATRKRPSKIVSRNLVGSSEPSGFNL